MTTAEFYKEAAARGLGVCDGRREGVNPYITGLRDRSSLFLRDSYLRVHRSDTPHEPQFMDFDDMDQALAKVCEWRLYADPIVFAAALSPHQREDEGPRGS